jgi:hypothetical protein
LASARIALRISRADLVLRVIGIKVNKKQCFVLASILDKTLLFQKLVLLHEIQNRLTASAAKVMASEDIPLTDIHLIFFIS